MTTLTAPSHDGAARFEADRCEACGGVWFDGAELTLVRPGLAVVQPGKRGYPFHCHHVNEEMFFVIEGSGTLRIGEEEYPLRKGDVIAAPAGGKATAHQTGTEPGVFMDLPREKRLSVQLARRQ